MTAVSDVLFVVSVFREFGVPVTFEPGWETRGNGMTADYLGGVVHHTATGYSDRSPTILRDGRSDLSGPLCNFSGLSSGGIHVVSANPANHAGASGGSGTGPLPVTTLFNRNTLGLEIVYPGVSPMTPAQYRTALVFSIAIKRLRNRRDHEYTRAHRETSREGKWDPGFAEGRTYDMAGFRRDAAMLETEGEIDMPLTDADMVKMWWGTKFDGQDNFAQYLKGNMTALRTQLAALTAAVQAATNDPDITVEQLDSTVDAAVRRHTPTAEQVAMAQLPYIQAAVRDVLGEDDEGQADAIVDALVARLGAGSPDA